jgi:TolB-like protein
VRPVHRWLVAGLLLSAATVGAVRYFSRPPLSPQSSALSTGAAPAALPLPDKPSIAVLPFTNMSNDPEQEYFNDGLTEDLITDLSKFSGLFVIARNSVFTYKGKAVKVAEVGRELGVRYVLEGSTRKAGERLRCTAQLVEAASYSELGRAEEARGEITRLSKNPWWWVIALPVWVLPGQDWGTRNKL